MAKTPVWSQLRATVWALYSLLLVRRALRKRQVDTVTVPAAPRLGPTTFRGQQIVLTLLRATCLERSLVRQRWLTDNGVPVEIVLGVSPPASGFTAHAWLDADVDPSNDSYTEIRRLPAPARKGRA